MENRIAMEDGSDAIPLCGPRAARSQAAEAAAATHGSATGRTDGRLLPLRIGQRPDPGQWMDDELMTLDEAAALFWPDGPIRTASLRTARKSGQLAVARIAGKLLTTKASVLAMTRNALEDVSSSPRDIRRRPETAVGEARGRSDLRAKIERIVSGG